MEEQVHNESADQREPELLYHYTDQTGLLGIVNKQELWATDVRFLNDTEEFEAGFKIAVEMAKQASALSGEDGRKTASYFEKMLRFSFTERPVYSVSLTGPLKAYETLPDQIDDPGDRLNMWRSYAARGVAYAVGLPRTGFSVNIEGVDLQECSYRRDTKEEYLTEILNSCGDLFNSANETARKKVGCGKPYEQVMAEMREEVDRGISKILPDLKSQVAACKHETFWEEREWRLTVSPARDCEGHFYSSGRFGITPRLRLKLRDQDGLLPIKRIVIGPCPHMADAIESLKGLVITKGYKHMEIFPSQIPYRNW